MPISGVTIFLEHAHHEAARLRHDADDYVMRSLAQLEQDMTRSLAVIRNGIHRLQTGCRLSKRRRFRRNRLGQQLSKKVNLRLTRPRIKPR